MSDGREQRRDRLLAAMGALRAGHLDDVEAPLRAVLDAEPRQPDALHLLGVWHHERGDTDGAVRHLRDAIAHWPAGDPQVFVAHNNLGNVLLTAGRVDEAEAAYRAALDARPDAGGTWTNLATLLRRLDRLDEAEDAARRAVAAVPDDAQGWFGLAHVLVERGDVPAALEAHSRGVTLAPRSLVGREQVLRALVLLGHRDEAAVLWNEWLAEHPDDPVARHHAAACAGDAPERASDEYVTAVFDAFAETFDAKLASLRYRAPTLVAAAFASRRAGVRDALVVDLGCGTGLCGAALRPYAAHLVGVDLSPGMLAHAARRHVYHELVTAEIGAYLDGHVAAFDGVVAADVCCYLGDLRPLVAAAHRALRAGGVLVFTVEAAGEGTGWTLALTGRFTHGRGHVVEAMAAFADVTVDEVELRTEAGRPVAGFVVAGTRRAPADA